METIGKRILEIRKNQKLTQTEFGNLFGVTHAHISNIERDKEKPSEMLLMFICDKLKINIEWLREGTGEMYSFPNFSVANDEGNRIKCELMIDKICEIMKELNGEELKIATNTISFFTSLLPCLDFKDPEERLLYFKKVNEIIRHLEIVLAFSNAFVANKKQKELTEYIHFYYDSRKDVTAIEEALSGLLNLYVSPYVSEEIMDTLPL